MATGEVFDWVAARHDCSVLDVFVQLQDEARRNVDSMNERIDRDRLGYGFRFSRTGQVRFSVRREANRDPDRPLPAIVFTVKGGTIEAEDEDGRPILAARPTITNERQCRLKVGDAELECWQVLRLALEELFFRR